MRQIGGFSVILLRNSRKCAKSFDQIMNNGRVLRVFSKVLKGNSLSELFEKVQVCNITGRFSRLFI